MLKQKSIEKMKASQKKNKVKAFNNHIQKKKETYFGDSEGKFPVKEKLNYQEAEFRLKNKLTNKNDLIIKNINIVRWHNRNETLKHFIAKSICSKVLMDNNQFISSEILDGDIYWINNDIYIEIQSKTDKSIIEKKKDKFNDLFLFDLKEVPDNAKEMYEYFKNKLGL